MQAIINKTFNLGYIFVQILICVLLSAGLSTRLFTNQTLKHNIVMFLPFSLECNLETRSTHLSRVVVSVCYSTKVKDVYLNVVLFSHFYVLILSSCFVQGCVPERKGGTWQCCVLMFDLLNSWRLARLIRERKSGTEQKYTPN